MLFREIQSLFQLTPTTLLQLGSLVIGLCATCFSTQAADQDQVILKNGKEVSGTIFQEDDFAIFLKLENGEERGIAKARIKEIFRKGQKRTTADTTAEKETPGIPSNKNDPVLSRLNDAANLQDQANNQKGKPAPIEDPFDDNKKIYEQLKDLGHPNAAKRNAAMENAKELGFRALPILLAMLNPKSGKETMERIGSLRALSELGPLDQQGAETIGFIAMKDKDFEVRREAARTIGNLKDDRALQYLTQFAISPDKSTAYLAANALREVNDDRAFAALAAAIPPPTVNAAAPTTGPTSVREMNLPIGPGGANVPLFLPTQEIAGTASDIMSEPAEALEIIARKKLGGLASTWIGWLREKAGQLTMKDIEEARRNRNIGSRVGSPSTR